MRFEDLSEATNLTAELTKTLDCLSACFMIKGEGTWPDPFENVHVDIMPHGITRMESRKCAFYDFEGEHPSIARLLLAKLFLAKLDYLEKLLAKIDLNPQALIKPHTAVIEAMEAFVKGETS
jgi:hypothetical protein